MEQSKACTQCGQIKLLIEFFTDKRQSSGVRPSCKKCDKSKYDAYRAVNLDKVRQASNNWKKNNYYDRRSYFNTEKRKITGKDKKRILSQPCIYCGSYPSTIDHVIPLSRGGRDAIGNLAPACGSCNSRKRNQTVMEWRIKCRRASAD